MKIDICQVLLTSRKTCQALDSVEHHHRQEKVNTYLLDLGPIAKLPHHQLEVISLLPPQTSPFDCVHHNFRHLPVHVLTYSRTNLTYTIADNFTNLPPRYFKYTQF